MNIFKKLFLSIAAISLAAISPMAAGLVLAGPVADSSLMDTVMKKREYRVTDEMRKAAAERLAADRAAVAAKQAKEGVTAPARVASPPSPGGLTDYLMANWAFSPPLRKFVDTLPGLNAGNANNLGQYIPLAVPDTTTYPGSDYYEIELRQYTEKMHSDLPPTTLRGYVQVNNGTDAFGQNTVAPSPVHYLGPTIVSRKDRPVRVKFTNKLSTGAAGNLFLPVDTTVMGAGIGPLEGAEMYTQNRATLHLHGGHTPWISDGTPHQWVTPAGETTSYPKGLSMQNVPDMPDPGDGSMTFFYTNQQSARLLFYHDHAMGITRLNVYAGEAAGYLITDAAEDGLIDSGLIPGAGMPAEYRYGIPLVIQDKSFVDASTIGATDPTWNWGTTAPIPNTGDLWYPHVYVPAQNPFDVAGVNPFGRWHYGPWFWPPTEVMYPPVANPYYDPINAPWQPLEIPGTPNPSMPGESFMDTPVVNGVAFPTVTVDPKAYRFRILNAANDRFWNLQLYEADPAVVTSDARTNTEVRMLPAQATPGFPETWPVDGRDGGVPDPATAGPGFIQIGSEGGFLPAPAVIPNQPVAWNLDPTTFNFGNVSDHALLLAPAERADVIVDFSAYAGKTLILYNDAPAAFPALDARYDYYTGAPDLTANGGHPGPQAGFGPNIRTIMQIVVANTAPAAPFDLATLEAAFASTADTPGVFAQSQNPVIVGQTAYDSTYNKTFPTTFPNWGVSRIQDNSISFVTVDGATLTLPMEPKAIQDEMGEAYDIEYGRMSGKLGLELIATRAGNQNFVLQNYVDPSTEILEDGVVQLWKITHNGVDTHPIHFHLFDVQLINRVGWDGAIRLPDANELGWKDTVRVSPLEDTIVALRPTAPQQPFGLPDSIRPLNPTAPLGISMGFTNIDPYTGGDVITLNQITNFGWEYVWHCHILSHEEMDMMRPISFLFNNAVPGAPAGMTATGAAAQVDLSWTDPTPWDGVGPLATLGNPANEIGFRVERAVGAGAFSEVGKALANNTSYSDTTAVPGTLYKYRVIAYNQAGDSLPSNVASSAVPSSTPQGISASAATSTAGAAQQVVATWSDGNGASDIRYAYMQIGSASGGGLITKVYYNQQTNKLYLLSDAGNSWLGGFAPGSANTITNSRVSLNCQSTAVTPSGLNLTVSFSITPNISYTGIKPLMLYVVDYSGAHPATWLIMGSWTILGPTTPANVSATAVDGLTGAAQQVNATWSDGNGASDIRYAYLQVGSAPTGGLTKMYYNQQTNMLYLLNDAGNGWIGGFAPGSANVIANSKLSLDCAATTVIPAGNNLTVSFNLTPQAGFAGSGKPLALYVVDFSGLHPATWENKGTWSILAPGAVAPANVSASAAAGTVGVAQQVDATWNDGNGASDIKYAYLQVGSVASGGWTKVYYNQQTNMLYLLNDAGNGWLGGFAPGSANVIANSKAELDCAATTVTPAGDNLAVSFNIKPLAGFTGNKPLMLYVIDYFNQSSATWQTKGYWVIN